MNCRYYIKLTLSRLVFLCLLESCPKTDQQLDLHDKRDGAFPLSNFVCQLRVSQWVQQLPKFLNFTHPAVAVETYVQFNPVDLVSQRQE
jgi:hypothetical protein